jgi:hypothetical protein
MSLNVQVLGCLGAFCVFANLALIALARRLRAQPQSKVQSAPATVSLATAATSAAAEPIV